MKSYKKVLPYLLSGCMALTGCYGPDTNGVVLEKKDNKVFVDTNNDKLADQVIDIYFIAGHSYAQKYLKYQAVYEYILPGDSVALNPSLSRGDGLNSADLKRVNGKTPDEIYELVKVRRAHNGKIR